MKDPYGITRLHPAQEAWTNPPVHHSVMRIIRPEIDSALHRGSGWSKDVRPPLDVGQSIDYPLNDAA